MAVGGDWTLSSSLGLVLTPSFGDVAAAETAPSSGSNPTSVHPSGSMYSVTVGGGDAYFHERCRRALVGGLSEWIEDTGHLDVMAFGRVVRSHRRLAPIKSDRCYRGTAKSSPSRLYAVRRLPRHPAESAEAFALPSCHVVALWPQSSPPFFVGSSDGFK